MDIEEWNRLLYQNAQEQIRYLKTRQWTVTFYAAVLYFVLFQVFQLLGDQHCWIIVLFSFIAAFVAFVSVTMIWDCYRTVQNERHYTEVIIEKYNDAFKELEDKKGLHKTVARGRFYPIVFALIIVIGWMISVALYIWAEV